MHNFHTHTYYCDGSSAPEEYFAKAKSLNFTHLGFSGHAPVPFENNFAIAADRLQEYADHIRKVRDSAEEGDPEIFIALEADYIPGITRDFSSFKNDLGLDYIIGSIHLVKGAGNGLWFTDGSKQQIYDDGLQRLFDGNAKRGVRAYFEQIFEMIETQRPEILGHFDKINMHNKDRYFTTDEDWYQLLIDKILELCLQYDVVVEVNTRGIYKKRSETTFPEPMVLKKMQRKNIPVMISSDAHKPNELALQIPETRKLLLETGFTHERIPDKKQGWIEKKIEIF